MVNFTALDVGPTAKTPDYTCSNNYGFQYMWRIKALRDHVTGPSSSAVRATDVPNCASSGVQLAVTTFDYSSQYSRVRPVFVFAARRTSHVAGAKNHNFGHFGGSSTDPLLPMRAKFGVP